MDNGQQPPDASKAALEAEARAALAGAPHEPEIPALGHGGLPGAGPEPSPEQILAGYKMVTVELVSAGAVALVPAWQVTPAETDKLGGAIAQALLLWFPDQVIPPKYMSLLVIAGVGFEIVQARRDPATGKLRPARIAPPADELAGGPAPDPHAPIN